MNYIASADSVQNVQLNFEVKYSFEQMITSSNILDIVLTNEPIMLDESKDIVLTNEPITLVDNIIVLFYPYCERYVKCTIVLLYY